MILSYYRRGAGVVPGCVQCESGGLSGGQLLLDFEEDQLCVVREIRRNGCIGGRHPWAAERRVWPGSYGAGASAKTDASAEEGEGAEAAEGEWLRLVGRGRLGLPGDCA